ncbi:hypothetical protein AK812_SmicGene30826 [Symbiodinium microadriaticum]|uniref:Uncharacterized protein n=1 Tax=Symbiodinium microadriaticum TaxID=2951 RepID=A0A1Q9CYD4_SYMMI|nr:hypothetical protein AK812_SmicGene30826 [Symbiodinium microadriaticum]
MDEAICLSMFDGQTSPSQASHGDGFNLFARFEHFSSASPVAKQLMLQGEYKSAPSGNVMGMDVAAHITECALVPVHPTFIPSPFHAKCCSEDLSL